MTVKACPARLNKMNLIRLRRQRDASVLGSLARHVLQSAPLALPPPLVTPNDDPARSWQGANRVVCRHSQRRPRIVLTSGASAVRVGLTVGGEVGHAVALVLKRRAR